MKISLMICGGHSIRGTAHNEADVLMDQMLERLINTRIRNDQRDDGGKQHDACGLRRRMGELEIFFVPRLMSANLVDEDRGFGVAPRFSAVISTPPEIDAQHRCQSAVAACYDGFRAPRSKTRRQSNA